MMHKKMFVVYVKNGEKKERLYFKANNVSALCDYLWYETNHEVAQIKELKRIYRKYDNFIEV